MSVALESKKKPCTYADYAKLPDGAPDLVVEVFFPPAAYCDFLCAPESARALCQCPFPTPRNETL